jgi:hypothetical protein
MSVHFDGVPITQIDSVMLTKFLTNITDKYFVSVVKMTIRYSRSVFAEAVDQDFLRKNPARGLKMPKHTKMVARPVRSVEQMQALHEASAPFGVRTREYALLRLLYVVRPRPNGVWFPVAVQRIAGAMSICRPASFQSPARSTKARYGVLLRPLARVRSCSCL